MRERSSSFLGQDPPSPVIFLPAFPTIGVAVRRTWTLDGEAVDLRFVRYRPSERDADGTGGDTDDDAPIGPVAESPLLRLVLPVEYADWLLHALHTLRQPADFVEIARVVEGGPVVAFALPAACDGSEPDRCDEAAGRGRRPATVTVGAETPLAAKGRALVVGEGRKALRIRFTDDEAVARFERMVRAARADRDDPPGNDA